MSHMCFGDSWCLPVSSLSPLRSGSTQSLNEKEGKKFDQTVRNSNTIDTGYICRGCTKHASSNACKSRKAWHTQMPSCSVFSQFFSSSSCLSLCNLTSQMCMWQDCAKAGMCVRLRMAHAVPLLSLNPYKEGVCKLCQYPFSQSTPLGFQQACCELKVFLNLGASTQAGLLPCSAELGWCWCKLAGC